LRDAIVTRLRAFRHPDASSVRRIAWAALPCILAVWFAWRYTATFSEPSSYYSPFTDAVTYLAAGERLNAGHPLYSLAAGDRRVALEPTLSPAAILSPPPIAVIWRPLAMVPGGFILWLVASWVAVLGATFYVVFRGGLVGLALALALSQAIGEQLAVANVAAFFPACLIAAWKLREHRVAGAIIGTLASLKLAPVAILGWLIGRGSSRAILTAISAVLLWLAVSVLGAGLNSIPDYVTIASGIHPSPMSVAGRTGIPWLSAIVLVFLAVASAVVSRRFPGFGFAIAVSASVLGTPALYISGWVTMLAVVAPLTDRGIAAPALAPSRALDLFRAFRGRLDRARRSPGLGRPALGADLFDEAPVLVAATSAAGPAGSVSD
jgi:hypothetical protein